MTLVELAAVVAAVVMASFSWHYGYDAMGRQSSQVAPVNQSAGATALDTIAWTYRRDRHPDQRLQPCAGQQLRQRLAPYPQETL